MASMRGLKIFSSVVVRGVLATKVKIADVIPKMAMGDRNTIYELQNYVVGLGPNGIVLNADGS